MKNETSTQKKNTPDDPNFMGTKEGAFKILFFIGVAIVIGILHFGLDISVQEQKKWGFIIGTLIVILVSAKIIFDMQKNKRSQGK